MKRIIAAFAIFVATAALATTTWTSVSTGSVHVRAVKATNSVATGIEPAPLTSTATTEGLNLVGLKGFGVLVRTTTGGNMTAGGMFRAHVWNKDTGEWHWAPDLDFAAYATSVQASSGYTVTSDFGRILFRPDTVGTTTTITYYGASTTGGVPRSR